MAYPPTRKIGDRRPKNVMLIIAEGKTEKIYFEGLKERNTNVEVKIPNTTPTDASNLVDLCKYHMKKNELDLSGGDVAICVMDVLGNDPKNLDEAIFEAKRVGITVALSNPCFELWFLLHYREINHRIDCSEAIKLLHKYISGYNKTKDYSDILKPHINEAVKRAKYLQGNTDDCLPQSIIEKNPSTDVHIIVSRLASLAQRESK